VELGREACTTRAPPDGTRKNKDLPTISRIGRDHGKFAICRTAVRCGSDALSKIFD
jgi:hypothetical protein